MSVHFGAKAAESVHGFCRAVGRTIGGAVCMLHIGEDALTLSTRQASWALDAACGFTIGWVVFWSSARSFVRSESVNNKSE